MSWSSEEIQGRVLPHYPEHRLPSGLRESEQTRTVRCCMLRQAWAW